MSYLIRDFNRKLGRIKKKKYFLNLFIKNRTTPKNWNKRYTVKCTLHGTVQCTVHWTVHCIVHCKVHFTVYCTSHRRTSGWRSWLFFLWGILPFQLPLHCTEYFFVYSTPLSTILYTILYAILYTILHTVLLTVLKTDIQGTGRAGLISEECPLTPFCTVYIALNFILYSVLYS